MPPTPTARVLHAIETDHILVVWLILPSRTKPIVASIPLAAFTTRKVAKGIALPENAAKGQGPIDLVPNADEEIFPYLLAEIIDNLAADPVSLAFLEDNSPTIGMLMRQKRGRPEFVKIHNIPPALFKG